MSGYLTTTSRSGLKEVDDHHQKAFCDACSYEISAGVLVIKRHNTSLVHCTNILPFLASHSSWRSTNALTISNDDTAFWADIAFTLQNIAYYKTVLTILTTYWKMCQIPKLSKEWHLIKQRQNMSQNIVKDLQNNHFFWIIAEITDTGTSKECCSMYIFQQRNPTYNIQAHRCNINLWQ